MDSILEGKQINGDIMFDIKIKYNLVFVRLWNDIIYYDTVINHLMCFDLELNWLCVWFTQIKMNDGEFFAGSIFDWFA